MSEDAARLSCYLLTRDSERYLERILQALAPVVDDLVIVDSGSTDRTAEIAARFGARFLPRRLDNFRDQRTFALEACRHTWVLSLDSDEVPDAELVASLRRLKREGFRVGGERYDAFRVKRRWFVLGREVHAFYPIVSPDHRIRLFRKDLVGFRRESTLVHETPTGYRRAGVLGGSVLHYGCDSLGQLGARLDLYTALAAEDMRNQGKRAPWTSIALHPVSAWIKWYVWKGGWKDGRIGLTLGNYAFRYTLRKYLKLRDLVKPPVNDDAAGVA